MIHGEADHTLVVDANRYYQCSNCMVSYHATTTAEKHSDYSIKADKRSLDPTDNFVVDGIGKIV